MSLCQCGGCGCASCNYHVTINPAGTETVFSCASINLSGIGTYDSQSGNTFQFRGVDSANALITITLDATNHTILLTANIAAITAAIPQATPTQAGIGETAIDAEAQAKASTTVFLTPSNLAALGASDTFAGLMEIATNAEAITGTSTTLAITPASLAAAIAANYGTTVTFADAVAKAAAVPEFIGQFGAEVDTTAPYVGTALVAGSWVPIFTGEQITLLGNSTVTTVSIGGGANILYVGDATTSIDIAGPALHLGAGAVLNLDAAPLQITGVATNSALLGNDGAGLAALFAINTFISSNNTQTGWAVTNPSVSRTLDVAAATLADLRAVVGTLINDLKAIKLPAT